MSLTEQARPGATLAGAVAVVRANARALGRSWPFELGPEVLQPLLVVAIFGGVLARDAGRVTDPGSALSWSYGAFVAIGVVTASAAISGAVDTAHLVFIGDKLTDRFTTIVTTPVSAAQLALGHVLWAGLHAGVVGLALSVLLAPMLPDGALVRMPLAVLVIALTGATLGAALALLVAHGSASPQVLNLIARVVVPPMFLFSGTVFGLGTLPGWASTVLGLLPVTAGCSAVRAVYGGAWSELGSPLLVLLVWSAVALLLLARRLDRELGA